MTKERVTEVLEIYRTKLSSIENKDEILSHCFEMLDKTRQFIVDDRIGKAFRWLGFIQGCLYSKGVYTIEEMKRHNKPL